MGKGKVWLVGAGPGDPGLLTLRAFQVLQEAEVILYDRLVSEEVLSLANPTAERIYVGKHAGEPHLQEEILHLMLQFIRDGRNVVRLKGGDPMVFGRGGEEWLFLVEHGVPVEVVPGVTSAIALPALAGVPLTYRGFSSGFAVVSGHCRDGLEQDWARYVRAETLVVLMGVKNRKTIAQVLIHLGRDPSEPVCFIERGSTPEERVIEATLGEVACGDVDVNPPAVWVIGEVVALRRILLPAREGCHAR